MPNKNFDKCVSFFIANGAFKGSFIRLHNVVNTILNKHKYPLAVSACVAETTALSGLLASMLKYEGLFTLQIQTNGPVSVLVSDVTSEGKMRSCAKYDEEKINKGQALRKTSGQIEPTPHLIGGGYLAFTVDQGKPEELIQGVVDIQGKTLAECALRYFKQSEQIDTNMKLFLLPPEGENNSWSVAGIMLQKIPASGGNNVDEEEMNEAWNEANIFMESLSDNEVFDANLSMEEILHRLFHANKLEITKEQDYEFKCRCNREKLATVLSQMSEDEIKEMTEQGKISAKCQFCGEEYFFNPNELTKQ